MQWLNDWYLIRSAGIVSYLLISLSMIVGLYMQVRKQQGLVPGGMLTFVHINIGNWGFYLGLFHGILNAFDQYEPFKWQELVIPFVSHYKNSSMGLGILAMYFLIITIFTSEFRSMIGISLWRKLHIFTPLVYFSATIHGVLIGTDTKTMLGYYMYLISVFFVLFLLVWRFTLPTTKPAKRSVKISRG
jgi:methionine sulfoxide reductase heme-binding subunit